MAIRNLTPYAEAWSDKAQEIFSRHSAVRMVLLLSARKAHSGGTEGLLNGFNGFL